MPPENPLETGDLAEEDRSQDGESELDESEEEEEYKIPPPPARGRVFRDESNHPINFFIHESVRKAETIKKLTADITENGGRVIAGLEHASVVLVDRKYQLKAALQTSYETSRGANLHKIHVKFTPFVMNCIQKNRYFLYEPEFKGMRGFPPGGRRTEFTEDDDYNLCYYLSRLAPDKEAGGRTGHNIYKRLVELGEADPDRSGWAARHPYDSWRGRYKRNQRRMDAMIEEMVAEDQPTTKQLWREDRRLNKRRVKYVYSSDEESEMGTAQEEEEVEDDIVEIVQQKENLDGGVNDRATRNKRTQSRRSSNHVEPSAKRPRIAHGHSQHSRDDAMRRQSTKGKERAFEEEEGEEEANEGIYSEIDYFELFGEDPNEPGPSARTLVSAYTQRRRAPTPDFLTQDTLVSATPRGNNETGNTQKSNQELPVSTDWPSPIHIPRNMQSPSVHGSRLSAAVLSSSPRNRVQKLANTSGPGPSIPAAKPTPLPTQPSSSEYQRPKMAARRPISVVRQPVVNTSVPSRNTRSRSQIPQPTPLPQKNKTKEATPEVIEVSDAEDAEEQPPAISSELQRIHETSEDEREVEKSFNVDDADHGSRQADQQGERAASMETDDAQIKRDLSGRSKGSSSLDINPSEILERLRTQSIKSQGVGNRSRHNLYSGSQLRSGTPGYNHQIPNRGPVTPTQWSRARSPSSAESFPISGTKASAMKKKLQQQEKNTPYKPPEGTRAAQLAKSR